MASMIYPDQNHNRTFILTWEGMSFAGKPIDLLVEENGERKMIGNIVSKEELENGKEFDLNGEKIFVQHKKVFAFIKELFLSVNGVKVKGRMI
ncbi:MAG: hypothetical protein WA057_00045 [Candidatus Magasanikiibacteriota bacterium]